MFTNITFCWHCRPIILFCMELSFKNILKVSFFLNLDFLYKITLRTFEGNVLISSWWFVCCGFVGRCFVCFGFFYFWSRNHKDTLSGVTDSVMGERTVALVWSSWKLPVECRSLPINVTVLRFKFAHFEILWCTLI